MTWTQLGPLTGAWSVILWVEVTLCSEDAVEVTNEQLPSKTTAFVREVEKSRFS